MALYLNPWLKGMPVKKLKELLDTLPEDTFIAPNETTHNLNTFETDAVGKPTKLTGWIDMSNESIEVYDASWDEYNEVANWS